MLRGFRKDGDVAKTLQRLQNNKKVWRGGLSIGIIAMFVLSSILINQSVQALNKSAGQYGYYGGSYGYGGSSNSSRETSDQVPGTVGSQATSVGDGQVVVSWAEVTTTRTALTNYDNHSSYRVVYGTSSSAVLSAYASNDASASLPAGTSVWTSTNDSLLATRATIRTTITSLTNGTTYYFAVYACDTNVNCSDAPASAVSGAPAAASSGGSGGGGGSTGGGTSAVTPSNTSITPTPGQTGTTPSSTSGPSAAVNFTAEAQMVLADVTALGAVRNLALETTYNARAKTVLGTVNVSILNFVTYGTPSTRILGAGERLGVVNSYRAAFGRVPTTEAQWSDTIKIANGRWPSETSAKAESKAKTLFKTVYKHNANMSDAHENAAVTVIAYGLRPAARNLASEKVAIKNYRGIFGRVPSLATDWDVVRAIAYSGAKR